MPAASKRATGRPCSSNHRPLRTISKNTTAAAAAALSDSMRARHRDGHAQVGLRQQRRRQARAFVAHRDRKRPPHAQRRTDRPLRAGSWRARARRARGTAPPTRQGPRPRRWSSGSARPAPRAAPWATTRTRSASTAAPARRPPRPRCAGWCRHCPDPAGRRAAGGSAPAPAAAPRGVATTASDAHAPREAVEICANSAARARQRRRPRACAPPALRTADRRRISSTISSDSGAPMRSLIDADQVLAFEHAAARLATVARRGDQPRRVREPRIVARGDVLHDAVRERSATAWMRRPGRWRRRLRLSGAAALPDRTAPGELWPAQRAAPWPAPRRLQLEEHLVVADHAELGARALLDGLGARLQVAHVGVERLVARLELGVGLALRRRAAGRSRAPAASRPCRATSDTAGRSDQRRRRGSRASARRGSSVRRC